MLQLQNLLFFVQIYKSKANNGSESIFQQLIYSFSSGHQISNSDQKHTLFYLNAFYDMYSALSEKSIDRSYFSVGAI